MQYSSCDSMKDVIQVLRRPLTQSSEGTSHALNHTVHSLPPSFKQVQQIHDPGPFHFGYSQSTLHEQDSQITRSKISYSLIEPHPLPCTTACGYAFHALAVHPQPNSLHIPIFRLLGGSTRFPGPRGFPLCRSIDVVCFNSNLIC